MPSLFMDSTFLFLTLLLNDEDECELLRAPQVDIAPLALFLAYFRRPFVARITNFAEEVVPLLSLDDFREHFRVTRPTFNVIVNTIHQVPGIPVVQVHGKEPIDCGQQVLLTLWYLGTQDSYLSLGSRFGVCKATAHDVVLRISWALCYIMDSAIVWPKTQPHISAVVDGFRDVCGFSGIIGAIDGSHINIMQPAEDEQSYYNRKKRHSIQLQAVCDSSMMFTDVYAGWLGSAHDSRVLRNSPLFDSATNNYHATFPGITFIVADSAYALRQWVLPTLKDNGNLTPLQKAYSKRLSRARTTIEQAFGLLKGRWRRLKEVNAKWRRFQLSSLPAAPCTTSAS